MRVGAALILCLAAALSRAEKVILIPLDSRPAVGQFAQLIARMASIQVIIPPSEMLGKFTVPGKPDQILNWLEQQPLSDVSAVIVSTDMVGYGGLIASRVSDTPAQLALERLNRLASFKRRHPNIRIYGMSAIMRLFPTSTKASASWRVPLGRYAEMKDRYRRTKEASYLDRIIALQTKIPPLELQRYEGARSRNFGIQQNLIRKTAEGIFDYLILGQDDAQPFGPHIPETQKLKTLTDQLQIGGKVYFCEGVDQLSNILVSRATLKSSGWTPRVRIVYSDDAGKRKIANYESKNVETSVRDQIVASGARPWVSGDYDYTLWLNTPDPSSATFGRFLDTLVDEVDQGFPAGVADINLGKTGTGDSRLFDQLWNKDRMIRLLAYAGWNTAGNTMGTSIPAANVYLLARRNGVFPLKRELAQREFVLHRFVNDYAYHKYVRPAAYKLIDSLPTGSREETYGEDFEYVNHFVQKDMAEYFEKYFREQFYQKRFFAGSVQYQIVGSEGLRVALPWPRAYEVRLDFRLIAQPVSSSP